MKTYASISCKVLLYVVLMVFFVIFYMKDQLRDFFEGRKTTSSKFEVVTEYQIPTMIVCMNPGIKETKASKYGFDSFLEIFFNDTENTFEEMFDDITYNLNTDFILHFYGKNLTLGSNEIEIEHKQDIHQESSRLVG